MPLMKFLFSFFLKFRILFGFDLIRFTDIVVLLKVSLKLLLRFLLVCYEIAPLNKG